MKKTTILCAALGFVLALTGCKTQESAYKKAYEKAKAQDAQAAAQAPIATEAPVVTPLQTTTPAQSTASSYDNATYRSEDVTVVSGQGLKAYSVVVGSFSLKANAEGLQSTLKSAGYDAQIVLNQSRGLYRVVATTYADKGSAVQSRNQFRQGNYPDAWLLFQK